VRHATIAPTTRNGWVKPGIEEAVDRMIDGAVGEVTNDLTRAVDARERRLSREGWRRPERRRESR
jgi:hypothetical protein